MQFSANWGHHMERDRRNDSNKNIQKNSNGSSSSGSSSMMCSGGIYVNNCYFINYTRSTSNRGRTSDGHDDATAAGRRCFPHFARLPLELQDMVIASCDHATRLELSRTSRAVRARVLPTVFRGLRFTNDPSEADDQLAFVRRHAAHVRHLSFVPKPVLVHPAYLRLCGTGAVGNGRNASSAGADGTAGTSTGTTERDCSALKHPQLSAGPTGSSTPPPPPPLVVRNEMGHLYDRHTGRYVVPMPQHVFAAYEVAFPLACRELLSGVRALEQHYEPTSTKTALPTSEDDGHIDSMDGIFPISPTHQRRSQPPQPHLLRFDTLRFDENDTFQQSVTVRDFDRLLGAVWKALRMNVSLRRFEFSGNPDLYQHMLYARPSTAPLLEHVDVVRRGIMLLAGDGSNSSNSNSNAVRCGTANAGSANSPCRPAWSLKTSSVVTTITTKDCADAGTRTREAGEAPATRAGGAPKGYYLPVTVIQPSSGRSARVRPDLRAKFYMERGFDDS